MLGHFADFAEGKNFEPGLSKLIVTVFWLGLDARTKPDSG